MKKGGGWAPQWPEEREVQQRGASCPEVRGKQKQSSRKHAFFKKNLKNGLFFLEEKEF